jgi:hypothetical protein
MKYYPIPEHLQAHCFSGQCWQKQNYGFDELENWSTVKFTHIDRVWASCPGCRSPLYVDGHLVACAACEVERPGAPDDYLCYMCRKEGQ